MSLGCKSGGKEAMDMHGKARSLSGPNGCSAGLRVRGIGHHCAPKGCKTDSDMQT